MDAQAIADAASESAAAAIDSGDPCDQYFAAQYTRCGGPTLPASELARTRARFDQICHNQIALPGSGMTPESVDACASALAQSPCELPGGPPSACRFHGSLPGGTACNEDFQCESGSCRGTAFTSPDGQIGPTTCGTCEPGPSSTVGIGQICAQGTFSARCQDGAICITHDTSAAMPAYLCVAITQGDEGAPCDDLTALCKTGFYCSAQAGQCAAVGAQGASCGEGSMPPGNPGGCAPPLSCVGDPGAARCDLGSEGAFCLVDEDCSPGLGCAPGPCSSAVARVGCSASGTCMPVTWVLGGQPCDGFLSRCLIGRCGGIMGPVRPNGGPIVCPTILSDGQPCSAQGPDLSGALPLCDTYAECFQPNGLDAGASSPGQCVLGDSVVCQ